MKYLLGIALGLLLFASVARADGFNPAEVYPLEIVFDYTLVSPNVHWQVFVLETQPQGADFEGSCVGPIFPATGNAYPYCTTDNPIQAFEPAGSTFDIAVDIFGFNPGLRYPGPSVTTPEPSTGGFLWQAVSCVRLSHYAVA